MLVFDCTNEQSFRKLQTWVDELRSASDDNTLLVLVANKTDLRRQRKVSKQRTLDYAREMECALCFETSAKTGEGLAPMFTELAALLVERAAPALDAGADVGGRARVTEGGRRGAEADPPGGCCI